MSDKLKYYHLLVVLFIGARASEVADICWKILIVIII